MHSGTPLWVSLILDLLATGTTPEEVLCEYPQLEPADIQACLAYAAEIAREHHFSVPVGA